MFNFDSLLGNPTAEEAKEAEFAKGFSDGVIMAARLIRMIADETTDKSPNYLEGLMLALREEI